MVNLQKWIEIRPLSRKEKKARALGLSRQDRAKIRSRLLIQGVFSVAAAMIWGSNANNADAQITIPRPQTSSVDRTATLEEQLVNRLKATRVEQRAYIKYIVGLTKDGRLDPKLVVAIERYAIRRNGHYPFPFFERALKYEANKRGLVLPDVQHFSSSRRTAPVPTGPGR